MLRIDRIMEALPSEEDRAAVALEVYRTYGGEWPQGYGFPVAGEMEPKETPRSARSSAVRMARFRARNREVPAVTPLSLSVTPPALSVTRSDKQSDESGDKVTHLPIVVSSAVASLASSETPATKRQQQREEAKEVLRFLNEKTGRTFRDAEGNLSLIVARLASGASLSDCKAVIARQIREWKDDEKMQKYLRPETLFNRTKFEGYLGMRERP